MSTGALQSGLDTLHQRIYFPGGTAFRINIFVLHLLFAVSLALVAASLLLRLKHKTLWLVRTSTNAYGVFICPAPAAWWLILSGIFLIILQPFLVFATKSAVVGSNIYDIGLWRSSPWIPLYLAGWVIAWSTFLQPIISVTRPASDSRWNLARYPTLINIFFLVVPCLFLISNLAYGNVANNYWNSIFSNYLTLSAGLTTALASPVAPPLQTLLDFQAIAQQLAQEGDASVDSLANTWIVCSVFLIIEIIIFAAGSISYLSTLSRSLTSLPSQASRRTLQSTYRSLVLTTIATLALQFFYLAASIFTAAEASNVAVNTRLGQWIIIAVSWIFASFGTVVQLSMFLRSFPASSSPTTTTSLLQNRNSSIGIKYPLSSSRAGHTATTTTADHQDANNQFVKRHDAGEFDVELLSGEMKSDSTMELIKVE